MQHFASEYSGRRLHYMQYETMEANISNIKLLRFNDLSACMIMHAPYQIQTYCLPDYALTISLRLLLSRTSTRRADGTSFTLLSQKYATEIRSRSGSGDTNSDCFSIVVPKMS